MLGNQSYHVSTSMDMNTIRPVTCQNPAGCLSGGTRPARERVTVGQGKEYIPGGDTSQSVCRLHANLDVFRYCQLTPRPASSPRRRTASARFNSRSSCCSELHSPRPRGGVDAPSAAQAQTGWSDRRNVAPSFYRGFALTGSRFAPPLLCEEGECVSRRYRP